MATAPGTYLSKMCVHKSFLPIILRLEEKIKNYCLKIRTHVLFEGNIFVRKLDLWPLKIFNGLLDALRGTLKLTFYVPYY